MKKGLLIAGGVVVIGSVSWLIYRKAKITKEVKKAEQKGFVCGGCSDKSMKCTNAENTDAIHIGCSLFPFGI